MRLGSWLLVVLRISVGKPQYVSEPRGLAVVTLPGPVASRRWAGGRRLQNRSVFRELEGETQLSSGASEMAVSGQEKLTSPSSGLGSYCPRFAEEKTDGQSLSPTAFPVLPVARAMAPCRGALHPPRQVPKGRPPVLSTQWAMEPEPLGRRATSDSPDVRGLSPACVCSRCSIDALPTTKFTD